MKVKNKHFRKAKIKLKSKTSSATWWVKTASGNLASFYCKKSLNGSIYKTQDVNVKRASQFHIRVNRFKHKHIFSGALWDLIHKVHSWEIVEKLRIDKLLYFNTHLLACKYQFTAWIFSCSHPHIAPRCLLVSLLWLQAWGLRYGLGSKDYLSVFRP